LLAFALHHWNSAAVSWAEFARMVLRAVQNAADDDVPARDAENIL